MVLIESQYTMENRYDIEAYNRAKKRVEEIKGFYWNLAAYIIVIPVIIFINYKTSWEFKWFWFSVGGWGLGISIHALTVFGQDKILGKDWEEKKIKEIMDKDAKAYHNGKL